MLKKIEDIKNVWLLVIVLLISSISLIPSWIHYDIIANDGAFWYIPLAKMYLNGKFLDTLPLELPVYPMLLAGISYLTGFNIELVGRILSAIFFVLSALGLFKLTQAVFKCKSAALIGVIFMITNRDLLDLSVDCLKETLVLCLIIWATYFMAYWLLISRNHAFLILSLVIYIFGALVRSTAVFFILSWYIVWIISSQKWKIRLALISVLFVFVIGAFYLNNAMHYNSLRTYNLDSLKINSDFYVQFIKYLECYFTASSPIVVIIALYGVISLFKKNVFAKFVASVFFVSLLIFSMRDYISDRYMLPIIIMFYPISAYIVLRGLSSGKKAIQIIGIIAIMYSSAQWVDLSFTKPIPRRLAIRQSGEWINENYGSDITISANQNRIIFYAGVETPIEKRDERGIIDLTKPTDIIAVDVSKDDGAEIKKAVEAKGYMLKKEIYPIFIYSSGKK
jgi:hypothetical protein